MPVASADGKALTGIRTSVHMRALYPNSAGSFGTDYLTQMRDGVSAQWPGLVKSFNVTPNREVITSYGMACASAEITNDPRGSSPSIETYDWDMTLVPQENNIAASPYYSMQYLTDLGFGMGYVHVNAASAGSCYSSLGTSSGNAAFTSSATSSGWELQYVGLYRMMLETAGTTLGARCDTVIGMISDIEISCAVGEEVMVSVSGPAVTYATGASDYFGAIGSNTATCVTTSPLIWNDCAITGETEGSFLDVRSFSLKASRPVNVQHRLASDAENMCAPWALVPGKNTYELKVTRDFESPYALNQLLGGNEEDVHFDIGDVTYIAKKVRWSSAPVNADIDTDDLIAIELTGTCEHIAKVRA